MPRPTTKQDLINTANGQFEKLWTLIDSMTDAEQNAPFAFDCANQKEAHWTRDKNLRDVLIHLYEWHQLLLNWVTSNQSGKNAPFLPAPYNWKTYGDMNVGFWNKHQGTSYDNAKEMLKQSHAEVIALAERFTDEELFTKKYYSWVGTTNLGSYCISATSSHYDWAIKKIKLQIKALRQPA